MSGSEGFCTTVLANYLHNYSIIIDEWVVCAQLFVELILLFPKPEGCWLRTALFWAITRRVVLITYGRFRTPVGPETSGNIPGECSTLLLRRGSLENCCSTALCIRRRQTTKFRMPVPPPPPFSLQYCTVRTNAGCFLCARLCKAEHKADCLPYCRRHP